MRRISMSQNCALVKSDLSHSYSNVSKNTDMMNRKRIERVMVQCCPLVLHQLLVWYSTPNFSFIFMFSYNLCLALQNFGGAPYFLRISRSSWWFFLSNTLTRLANITKVSKFFLYLRWSNVLIVNVPSWHPAFRFDPNWYLAPCFTVI